MSKSKRKVTKLILLITIILISLLGYKLHSIAASDISTYMAIYGDWQSRGTNGDTYTQNVKNGYLADSSGKSISEDTIKGYLGKSVGYPWTKNNNDYWYVKNYEQVWCLSEGKINSTDSANLRIYGIMEIGTSSNPTYTKLYYLNGNKEQKVQKGVAGISESRRAQSAFTMLVGSNTTTDNITGIAQKHFYDTYASALKSKTYLKRFYDSDVPRSNTSLMSEGYTYETYANEISDLNTPIDKDNYKNLTCENKSFTNSGLDMETVIKGEKEDDSNVFNMSSNSSLVTSRKMILTKSNGDKITYNIKKDGSKWYLYSGSTKKGRIVLSSGNIYLTDEITVSNVEIQVNYKYIHGILYMIGGNDTQTRAVSKGRWETGTFSSSVKVEYEEEITDVSMQKYIFKVNDKNLGYDENGNYLRASTKTVSDESNKGIVNGGTFKKAAKANKFNVKDYYKGANPVQIKVGDKVTYRISVYNNTEYDAYDVRVEDRLPYFYENLGTVSVQDEDSDGNVINVTKTKYKINTAAEVESIKLSGNDITEDFTDKRETKSETSKAIYTGSFKRITYTIDKLGAGKSIYFEITLSFNIQLQDKVLTNSAFLYCDGNQKTYRTTDRDYVKMTGEYKVSLEKFVSKVNGENISGRTGTNQATAEAEAVSKYRYNESMKTEGNNLHYTKYNNAVPVDSGDTVTFTIRLRNTGDTPVKITKIYDSFKFVEEGTYNGLKLKFDSAAGITGNGGGTIVDEYYGDDDNNANKNLSRYLITFENATLLNNNGDYVDVNMTYTVEIPTELTSQQLILQNKAKIVSLENSNHIAVNDADGSANNADMDFLTNKRYSVSLEKYVSTVTSKNNESAEYSEDRKDHRHNEDSTDTENKDPHKENKKVDVEIGDTVQYTIKLTNTGDNPVKITQIYDTFGYVKDDSFSVKNKDGTKNVGLKYIGISASTEYTASIENYEYNPGALKDRFNRYLINISGNAIQPDDSIYIYLTYEVDIPYDISNESYELFNKAGIEKLNNERDIEVLDSDGQNNNRDMDWVKTQIYKVSLKKYVSKVTDINGDNEASYDRSATRFNYYAVDKTKLDNYNPEKKNNPVMVEAGDKVTYTIILKNEGDTSAKINEIYDYYSNEGLEYDSVSGIKGNGDGIISETSNQDPNEKNSENVTRYKISFRNPITLQAGESIKVNITFNVTSNISDSSYCNVARINRITNKNDIDVLDGDGTDNNTDEDWIKLKKYAVSLEKYVYQINGQNLSEANNNGGAVAQRAGKAEYLTYKDGQYIDETANDTEYTQHNQYKYNNTVTVSNGNSVTYRVVVTNDGDTSVYITEIADYLPDGVIYNGTTYNDGQYNTQTDNQVKFTNFANEIIKPGESKVLTITVDKVIEPDNSNNVLKNVAEITASGMKNRNGITVTDTTPNNNKDADYLVLNYDDPDPEFIDYNVEKIWDDGNNVAGTRKTSVRVQLYQNNKAYLEPVELNGSNNWKHTWSNLPKADENGVEYQYRADETQVPTGYTKSVSDSKYSTVITNTRETITKTVRKVWKDENGSVITTGLSEITVNLYQNGAEYKSVKLNNDNGWKYTWTLPKKDDQGKDYEYIVKEVNVPNGYTASYDPDGEGIIITNTKGNSQPETVTRTVKKVWKDEDGKEISNTSSFGIIRVQLTQDGIPMDGYVVELNSSNNWSHTWTNLPKANGGNEYQYSVKELNAPEGYTVNITPSGDEIIVTNKKEKEPETVSKTVNKVWLDTAGNKIDGSETIKVQLYNDDGKVGDEVTLKADKNWTYTWEGLDKYDNKGNEYQYRVEEVKIPEGYSASVITNGNEFTIQNKQIEYTEITVKKGWVDNNNEEGKRPDSVTVQLLKNGTVIYQQELKANKDPEKNWTHTWDGLLQSDDYTVKEVNVPEGYTPSYSVDGTTFIIKNIYEGDPILDPDPPTPDLPGESVISGYVWNDEAYNKVQTAYNGIYDLEEDPVYGIEVKLYRVEDEKIIATATTNLNGYYGFSDADLALSTSLAEEEKFIKGKKVTYIDPETGEKVVTNVWASYYSYYVVFEYDGITYTSTFYSDFKTKSVDSLFDSNAKEDNGIVSETRVSFNNRFNTINSNGAYNEKGNKTTNISYYTTNKDGYIPQSIHYYNDSMSIQSSTSIITMQPDATDVSKDLKLKYVNLGLRGKDIFDLELTSDVAQIDVIINNQKGVYKYANKVTLRKQDIVINDDMANVRKESSNKYVESQEQRIRETDMSALQEIKVTYKITVHNTSRTAGTATKITNYYDSKYSFVGAYATLSDVEQNKQLSRDNNLRKQPNNGDKYGYETVITNWGTISQAGTKDIYVVYTLKDPANTLKDKESLPTYNMAEITEYRTECGTGQSEYTRGLLDKDSAPGSANKEKVRLDKVDQMRLITNGSPTTVDYYFSGEDLSIFKYEDDTFATPTLYFVKDGNKRQITGTVFEDKTTVDSTTRIKTGNGKLDEGEVGIYGATVQLIELKEEEKNEDKLKSGEQIELNGKYYPADTKSTLADDPTTSDENELGTFIFEGFLPGNYIIRYSYGNTEDTVLLNQYDDGKEETTINGKSYNGEDFQSTNNTGTHGALKLDSTEDYWYVYNEQDEISTATDDISRRSEVSKDVVKFTDEQMTVLNNMRDGIEEEASEVEEIIAKTKMYAETNQMLFTVEKTEDLDNLPNSAELLEKNLIIEQTREDGLRLAQWAVFPGTTDYYKEYTIRNMHFGIAEVPVTTVDLQKHVSAFTITDSTGNNVIASMELEEKEDGTAEWKLKGDVLDLRSNNRIDVSVENEELQGARLEITYKVIANMNTEVNFDGQIRQAEPTITGIVDFVDNNLSYNETLGENSRYWEVTTYDYIHEKFAEQIKFDNVTPPEGTVDPSGTKYTTILKAKDGNPLLRATVGNNVYATVTLEKVLTSTDSTIEEIITSTLDTSAYNNIVEIVGFDYLNTSAGAEGSDVTLLPGNGIDTDGDGELDVLVMRDRIRTPDRKIIIPGVQHDYATAEVLVIHPPTGDSSISMVYLIVAIVSLGILAAGVFGIKKFVVKK